MGKEKVTKINQISAGDTVEIEFRVPSLGVKMFKVKEVRVTPKFGTEIFLGEKDNFHFNLGMYLEGQSVVKDLYIIT